MKKWKELTDTEKGELLLAHQKGEVIECLPQYHITGDCWSEISNPSWLDNIVYRVKPEETTQGKVWNCIQDVLQTELAYARVLVDNEPRIYPAKYDRGEITIKLTQEGILESSTTVELYDNKGVFLFNTVVHLTHYKVVEEGHTLVLNDLTVS